MRKIVLVYGGIAGGVIISTIIVTLALGGGEGTNMASMEWLGYLTMIVALSLIFVGIKRYRDQHLGGVIRFGRAFVLGLGITAVASVIYVGAWEVNLQLTDFAFIDQYSASLIEAKRAEGASAEEVQAVVAETEKVKEQYQNPLFRLAITFTEIFPVGLLVSLVSALILRKSNILPAGQNTAAA